MTNVATLMIGQQLKSGWIIRALKPTLPAATGGFALASRITASIVFHVNGMSGTPAPLYTPKIYGLARVGVELCGTVNRLQSTVY